MSKKIAQEDFEDIKGIAKLLNQRINELNTIFGANKNAYVALENELSNAKWELTSVYDAINRIIIAHERLNVDE